jgi:hypothetical protein
MGPDVTITLRNPWWLPKPPSVPVSMQPRADQDADKQEARLAALEAWIEQQATAQLTAMLVDWNGVTDEEGQPLPLPKDDPTVLERLPRAIRMKVQQAIAACEVDVSWDPTKRPNKPQTQTPPETPPTA